jgi:hypothetical protein
LAKRRQLRLPKNQPRLVSERLQFQFQFFRQQRLQMLRQRLRAVQRRRSVLKKLRQHQNQRVQPMMILIHAIAIAAVVVVVAVAVVRRMREQLLIPKRVRMKQIPNQAMLQPQKVAMAQHTAVAVADVRQARMSHQVKLLMKMVLSQL